MTTRIKPYRKLQNTEWADQRQIQNLETLTFGYVQEDTNKT